jgi:hypothetical protein
MAGPGLLTVWGEGGGGVDQGVELVGVVVDLGGQGVHRLRVGQVAGQHPVGPSGPGRADRIQDAGAAGGSRQTSTTSAPRAASSMAVARPSMPVAPVTTLRRAVAVWASSFIGKGSLVCGRSHGILSRVIHSQV